MTWILGSAIPFGYGALISDIRVTWPGGRYLDGLQKIYPVGSMLMAGFAGSVEIGFDMIDDLQNWLTVDQPPDFPDRRNMWRVQEACWRWHRRGRRIFSHAAADRRRLGCQLLIVGTSPFPNGPFGLVPRCVRMVAPDFHPEQILSGWSSIGTGGQHESARGYAQSFLSAGGFPLLQGEVMNPGGAASATAMSVGISLMNEPMLGVSPLLQVGRVTGREHLIEGHRVVRAGEPDRTPTIRLARSFAELDELCRNQGATASAAQT